MKKKIISLLLIMAIVFSTLSMVTIDIFADGDAVSLFYDNHTLANGTTLPAQYYPLEYIQSPYYDSNGPYIDTGITVTSFNTVTMSIKANVYDTSTSVKHNLMGITKEISKKNNDFSMGITKDSASIQAYLGIGVINESSVDASSVHTYTLTADESQAAYQYTFSVDGAVVANDTYSTSIKCIDRTIMVGSVNNGNQSPTSTYFWSSNSNLYEAVIIKDGAEVWHGYPCYDVSNAKCGMYDTVSGSFFSSGNTNAAFLTLHNVYMNCYEENLAELPLLPSGYTAVPYIETTRNQFIDTGIKPTVNEKIELNIRLFDCGTSLKNACILGVCDSDCNVFSINFGGDKYSYNYVFNWLDKTYESGFGNSATAKLVTELSNIENRQITITADRASGKVAFGQYSKTAAKATAKVDNTLALFANHLSGGSYSPFYRYRAMIYSCKLYDGNTLQRDYVPCVNEDGIAGLYDLVEGEFYRSASGEDFVAGSMEQGSEKVNVTLTPEINTLTNAYEPVQAVSYDGTPLTEGVDYTVTYYNNTSLDTGKAVINGIGNYKDCYIVYFKNYDYNGDAVTLESNPYCLCNVGDVITSADIRNYSFKDGDGNAISGNLFVKNNSITITKNQDSIEALFVPDKVDDTVVYESKLFNVDVLLNNGISYKDTTFASSRVYPITIGGRQTLIIPNTANPEDLTGKLTFVPGTVLTGTVAGESLTVGTDELDLTEIFGEIVPSTRYTVNYVNEYEENTLDIYFAPDTLSNVYITLDSVGVSTLQASKANFDTGYVLMQKPDGSIVTGSEMLSTEIACRGNTSFRSDVNQGKYSYKFKLESKKALVNDNDGNAVKSKNWALIANNSYGGGITQDVTGFANTVGYDIYQGLDGDGAVSYTFVNLYIDGEYKGVYQLVEKATNEAKKDVTLDESQVHTTNSSIAVSDSSATFAAASINGATYRYCSNASSAAGTGFVIEMEYYSSTENCYVKTSRNKIFSIKEPNYPTKAQMESLAVFLQDFENALFSKNGINSKGKQLSDYMDLASVAKQFIVYAFQGAGDYFLLSTYLTVDCDNDGSLLTLKAGNVWDMNGVVSGSHILNLGGWVTEEYRVKFMKNGEFVAELNKLFPTFYALAEAEYTKVAQMYSDMQSAMVLNDLLWNRDFATTGQAVLDRFSSRLTVWDTSWSDDTNALRGVTITADYATNTFTANAVGATGYQWYKLNTTDYTGEAVTDATSSTYTPAGDGIDGYYYVVATGTALAGTACSNTMYSNSIYVGAVTVSFEMNGHGTQTEDIDTVTGSTLTAPTTPVEEGFIFLGWYKDEDFATPWCFGTDIVETETVTLYAKWVADTQVAEVNGTTYATLADALDAAKKNETVTLYQDITDEDFIVVSSKRTLDLNGHSITGAKLFYVTGAIVDTGATKGVFSAEVYSLPKTNQEYTPIYDSTKGGYSLFKIAMNEQCVKSENSATLTYALKKGTDYKAERDAAFELMTKGFASCRMKSIITISWSDETSKSYKSQVFTFMDSKMQAYCDTSKGENAMMISLSGFASLPGTVKAQAKFVVYDTNDNVIAALSTEEYTLK